MIFFPTDSSFNEIAFLFLPQHLLVLPSPLPVFVIHSNVTTNEAFALISFLLVAFPFYAFFPQIALSLLLILSKSSCLSCHPVPLFLPLCDWFKTLQLPLMWLLLIKPHFPPLKHSPKHEHSQMRDWRRVQTRENK